eukprot:TRINITY_DN3326_c0_g2_i1.p2 TRINITY_DN3326_c0_g2~~TRINITY_DN3326_c0_g2_i1.p2  ORF type:complete len:120 (-),score=12.21 TRINITY_DN3326_c0_g2_i1:74-433(-)
MVSPQIRFCILLFFFSSFVSDPVAGSSKRPLTDEEIRERKSRCYEDVQNGLWGWKCKSSVAERENCALKCLDYDCYELIYGDDPIEEGEVDYKRGHEFKYCMVRLSAGDSIEKIKRNLQ